MAGTFSLAAVIVTSGHAPTHRRASVVSAFYIVGYLGGNAVPVLMFGAVVDRWGLAEAMIGLTACVSLVALFVIIEAMRAARDPLTGIAP